MTASDKKKRVGKACDNCRLRKTKCNGKKPCDKCLLDNKLCTFSERRREKEKHYPPGYLDLLETRCNLLSKSIVKLVDLSLTGHDMKLFFGNVKYQNDGNDEDPKVNINKIIECLIQNNDLLKDEPIVWDEGTQIASRFDSQNAVVSIKKFADHSRKISNCSSIGSSSFIEDVASKIIDTHASNQSHPPVVITNDKFVDNSVTHLDNSDDKNTLQIHKVQELAPESFNNAIRTNEIEASETSTNENKISSKEEFPYIKKEGSPILESFPVEEEEEDPNSPYSSVSDEYNKILTRNNTINSASSWLDSSDFNSLFSTNSNNNFSNSLSLNRHNSNLDTFSSNVGSTLGNAATSSLSGFNTDINSDFDMQFIKPKNMLFFEDNITNGAGLQSSMLMYQNNDKTMDLNSEFLDPLNNNDDILHASKNSLILINNNNEASTASPINSPVSSPMHSTLMTPSGNSASTNTSLSLSSSNNSSTSPLSMTSNANKKLGHVGKSVHHYHAHHNPHLNLNNHHNHHHYHHNNNNNTNVSNSNASNSSISPENVGLHHHHHHHHHAHGNNHHSHSHHSHYDEELSKILEDRLLNL